MEQQDGHYFLEVLKSETSKLDLLAKFAETELETSENVPEDACGKLRAAAGKARLLMRQKLRQFEQLCNQSVNATPTDAFPIKNEDLAGFWDMVKIQIDQIERVFEELEKLKKNGWRSPEKSSHQVCAKKQTKAFINKIESIQNVNP